MTLEQAKAQVAHAVGERKRWGKHFSINDLPHEFLDAVTMVFDDLEKEAVQATRVAGLEAEVTALRGSLALANRQLGASKSRETQLKQRLAEVIESKEVQS